MRVHRQGRGVGHHVARRAVKLAVVLAASCTAAPALAAPKSKDFSLSFRGSPNCGDRAALVAAVQRRVPLAQERDAGETRIIVQIQDVGARSRAEVTLDSGDGVARRRIRPVACAALLDAVAVMIALTLDPPSVDTEAEPAREPESPASPEEPSEPAEQPLAPPASSAPPSRDEPQLPQRPSPPSLWRVHSGIIAGAETRTAATPILLVAGKLGFETRFDHPGWFSPSVRVEGSYGAGPTSSDFGAPWDFRLQLLRVLLCPVRTIPNAVIRWRACVVGEGGQLRASSGVVLEGASEPRMLWLGAGASVAAEVVLGRYLSFEIGASSVAMFQRGRFFEVRRRGDLLNETPPVALGLSFSAVSWFF